MESQAKSLCKGGGWKSFQKMRPTFAIEVARDTTIHHEFLDNSDPFKSVKVRKKAREWVNRKKEHLRREQEALASSQLKLIKGKARAATEQCIEAGQETRREYKPMMTFPRLVITDAFDQFHQLPQIGRRYDHIIEFFLSTDMEEIPCSDDKYVHGSKRFPVPVSIDNTIFGNMAKNEASFILWLYATVLIRDGMLGCFDTEEIRWFHARALKVLRETVRNDVRSGVHSDHMLNSLGCITAIASFSGQIVEAQLHRDAMIRFLYFRGKGDVKKGLLTAPQWTVKAVQWCEMMVASHFVEVPMIPYLRHESEMPAPQETIEEADRRTSNALRVLPRLSESLQKVFHQLHYLGILCAHRPAGARINAYIIQPLSEAEYDLLHILAAQKKPGHTYSMVEVLLAATFQLYLWTGPRALPPQTRLCNSLVSHIVKALIPILSATLPDLESQNKSLTVPLFHQGTENIIFDYPCPVRCSLYYSPESLHAVIWSLALGTLVSKSLDRPDHLWFREQLRLHVQAAGFDSNEKEYFEFLQLFPATDDFARINLTNLREWLTVNGV